MQNNTGLRLINTTSNTIEIDLLEQGQTGANVPVASTLAQTVTISSSVLLAPLFAPISYWVNNVDVPFYAQNLNKKYNIDPSDVNVNVTGGFNSITYSDFIAQPFIPNNLTNVSSQIKTLFETYVGVPNSINVIPDCKLYTADGVNFSIDVTWNLFYLVDISLLGVLMFSIDVN